MLLEYRGGKSFNLTNFKAKTKMQKFDSCAVLHANGELIAYKERVLQSLISCFAHACQEFSLTMIIKQTNLMGQNIDSPPAITVDGNILDAVNKFMYLGSIITTTCHLRLN